MDKEIIRFPENNDVVFTEYGIPTEFPSHWHNAAEFTVILKKGCIYRIGDTDYEPAPGDILLVWPRELHEIVRIPKDSSAFVQFSSRLTESNADLVAASRFLNECHLISHKKNPELAEKLREIIFSVRDFYKDNHNFLETRSKIIVYEMLVLIGEHVLEERKELIGFENFSDKSWEYIRNACSYVAKHSAEDISQAKVAHDIGLSPYYFSKLFNEYTQMTFPAYLSSIRVQNAINLLSDDTLTITECAFSSGFQSTTTFNKVFFEHTGCSPRDYRKLHNNNPKQNAQG